MINRESFQAFRHTVWLSAGYKPAPGESRGAPCDATGTVTKIQYGGICQEMSFFVSPLKEESRNMRED